MGSLPRISRYAEAAREPQITAGLHAGDQLTDKTVARLPRQARLAAGMKRRDHATPATGHGWSVADLVLARPFTTTRPIVG